MKDIHKALMVYGGIKYCQENIQFFDKASQEKIGALLDSQSKMIGGVLDKCFLGDILKECQKEVYSLL